MESLVQAIIAVLAIADPLGAVAVFLDLTGGMTGAARRRAALRASLALFVILTVAALTGDWVLRGFRVSMPAFRAGGGLVILLMGLEMLGGRRTRVQPAQESEGSRNDAILVPLAMPLIAGPGAIATVMTLASRSKPRAGDLDVLLAVLVTALATLLTLLAADWVRRRITERAPPRLSPFHGPIPRRHRRASGAVGNARVLPWIAAR